MRARSWIGAALVSTAIGSVTVTAGDEGRRPPRQSAMVYLAHPTLIGSTVVQGSVLFTHDAGRMARGEPCTSVRLVDSVSRPLEDIAAFQCSPRPGMATNRFELTTRPNPLDGLGCILIAYQFAGDPEVHGVPVTATAH
jgi:hypothetical protein